MLGLCCDKTYGAMMKYDDRYDNRDNDVNEDGNEDKNAADISGSDGPIFNLIATPRSRLIIAEEHRATTTTTLWPCLRMYLRVGIYLPYKYPINAIVYM